jgi:Dolichyl-phosphate-mannose-protein mannosyltransferase
MTTGDRLEKWAWWLDRRPALIVVLLAAMYLALIAPSVHRHLWYDELHTFYIAQATSMHRFIDEIRLLDLNPPLTYVLVRVSMRVLGPTELGARMPAIIGYFLGSMGAFVFIARRVGALWAAAGVGLFWCNEFFYLSAEARPYGILVAFLGLTLVSWDRAANYRADQSGRWRALAGVAVGATGMLLSHVYAPLWIMPFWVAELVRDWRQRRVDWPLWATLILPLAACLTYIPLVQNVSGAVFPSWFQGSLTRALAYYLLIVLQVWPALLAALLAAFAISLWRRHGRAEESGSPAVTATGFQAPDLAFLLASLLPPALLNALGSYRHVAFYGRHGFPTVLTASVLILLFIAYESRANRLSGLVAALVILGFTLLMPVVRARRAASAETAQTALQKDFERTHPELPLVVNSALTYLEMDHYENPALVARLYYLVDPESAIRYTQSNLTEGLLVMKQYFPIRSNVSSYADFAAAHRHFLVWGETGRQQGWLLTKLESEGAQVKEIGHFDTPYPDSRMYEVTLSP